MKNRINAVEGANALDMLLKVGALSTAMARIRRCIDNMADHHHSAVVNPAQTPTRWQYLLPCDLGSSFAGRVCQREGERAQGP